MVPTAVIAAKIDPQKAAKKPIAITIEIPKPPGQCPTREVQKLTRRFAAPPLNITIPANIKRGTATRMCLVNAANDICISTDHGKLSPQMAAKDEPSPKTMKIGTAKINSTTEVSIEIKNNLISFSDSIYFLAYHL